VTRLRCLWFVRATHEFCCTASYPPDIEDWIELDTKKTNIKPMTFFTGFWDTETEAFHYESFTEAGIKKMVFEKAVEILKEKEYDLTDISDPSKSKKKVCKISWKQDAE
jgi:hypothetical protein